MTDVEKTEVNLLTGLLESEAGEYNELITILDCRLCGWLWEVGSSLSASDNYLVFTGS